MSKNRFILTRQMEFLFVVETTVLLLAGTVKVDFQGLISRDAFLAAHVNARKFGSRLKWRQYIEY